MWAGFGAWEVEEVETVPEKSPGLGEHPSSEMFVGLTIGKP